MNPESFLSNFRGSYHRAAAPRVEAVTLRDTARYRSAHAPLMVFQNIAYYPVIV